MPDISRAVHIAELAVATALATAIAVIVLYVALCPPVLQ
jgi:hypothetical protein